MSKIEIELPFMEYLKAVNGFLEILENSFLDMQRRMQEIQRLNNKMIENIEFAQRLSEAGGVNDDKGVVH